jgi:hypothetical protein
MINYAHLGSISTGAASKQSLVSALVIELDYPNVYFGLSHDRYDDYGYFLRSEAL